MPKAADQDQWTIAAKNILKAELKRRGITYAKLAVRLGELGVHETERNLNNKISRGGFTAGFFVMCLEAVGCGKVQIGNH